MHIDSVRYSRCSEQAGRGMKAHCGTAPLLQQCHKAARLIRFDIQQRQRQRHVGQQLPAVRGVVCPVLRSIAQARHDRRGGPVVQAREREHRAREALGHLWPPQILHAAQQRVHSVAHEVAQHVGLLLWQLQHREAQDALARVQRERMLDSIGLLIALHDLQDRANALCCLQLAIAVACGCRKEHHAGIGGSAHMPRHKVLRAGAAPSLRAAAGCPTVGWLGGVSVRCVPHWPSRSTLGLCRFSAL